jgi:hypothetical protein
MRITWIPVVLLLLASAGPAAAADTSEIIDETARKFRGDNHLVTFWWLPVDYWVAAAREADKTEAEVQAIAALYENYTLIGALDVQFRPDGEFDALSTAEIVRRLEIYVDDAPFEVLKQVDPKLQQMAPELAYAFQVSLVELGRGLRLLPLPNVDKDGKSILTGRKPGVLRIRYRATAGVRPVEFWWHAPLTAVDGAKKCPGTGAPMEASWKFCPWSGKPAD